jgi:maltose/moltooligosaccharide transporter
MANPTPLSADSSASRAPLTTAQLINMAVGFLGLQFAWSIQMGQMSALYQKLGASDTQFSIFWMAGPITGILVQPIIGSLSDRTWCRLGRRRPFFLIGALLTGFTLILMPNVARVVPSIGAALVLAALLLWVLDASINTSMGPYRALIPDIAPPSQHATANAFIALTIGAGAVASFYLGGVDLYAGLARVLGEGSGFFRFLHSLAPSNTHLLFYIGALTVVAAIGYTVFTTREHPPEDMAAFRRKQAEAEGFGHWVGETWRSILHMPGEMAKLCVVQFFTWFPFFCLFIFFTVYVAENIYGATPNTPLYEEGTRWASLCFMVWNVACTVLALVLGRLADRIGKKVVHGFGLLTMAAAFSIFFLSRDPVMAMVGMGVLGIGWATTVSIPYALLAGVIPKGSEGVLMGTFNIFICIPQLVCAAIMGAVVDWAGSRPLAFAIAGVSSVIALVFLQFVREVRPARGAKP